VWASDLGFPNQETTFANWHKGHGAVSAPTGRASNMNTTRVCWVLKSHVVSFGIEIAWLAGVVSLLRPRV